MQRRPGKLVRAAEVITLLPCIFLIQAASRADFTNASPMLTPRVLHTATLLANGKVLVAGGIITNRPVLYTASAELYDPATGSWVATGPMAAARRGHTATLLPNGKVLVAGGSADRAILSSAELYDPATGTWTNTGSLKSARAFHTATLLPSGQVLVVGGNSGGHEFQGRAASGWSYNAVGGSSTAHASEGSAELYDPANGTWTPTSPMKKARMGHTATLLFDGRVLVAGGSLALEGAGTAELYTPSNGTWAVAGPFRRACGRLTASLLPNGKVLAVGGGEGRPSLASAELLDPVTECWAPLVNELNTARHSHTATLLPDGKLLVTGGVGTVNGWAVGISSAELLDPATGQWTETSGLTTVRNMHTATLLPNGSVLLAGGWGTNGVLASTELFVPANAAGPTNVSPPAVLYAHIPTLPPVPKPPPPTRQSAGGRLLSNASYEVSLLADSLQTKLEEMHASATEPGYNGHPLSYWLRDLQYESSAMPTPLRPEAKAAIAHIGTNAIPLLVKWMEERSASGFADSGTIQAFRILGPSARTAIPELARLATNQPGALSQAPAHAQSLVTMYGYGPLQALGGIGPDAVPALVSILTNGIAPGTRISTIEALTGMGAAAQPAVPYLIPYVSDENDMVAMEAVTALGAAGPGNSSALKALEEVAQGPRLALRGTALMALGHFGDQAVPALVRALGDTNRGHDSIAFHTLVYAAPTAITNAKVLAIAAAGLQSQDADRRDWAAWVLRAIGQQANGIKPDLMVPASRHGLMLQDATNVLRRLAPELLGVKQDLLPGQPSLRD